MSTRYLGGIIRKTPLALDPALGNAANGVFTMNQYMQAVKDGTWPGFDPYFNETVLLLHGNGTNGAQNNTFLDSSTNNFTITRNGNTTQGTFSPFSAEPGKWGNYFDGSGDYLQVPDNSAFDLGSSDFTIEAWIYLDKFPTVNNAGCVIGQDQFDPVTSRGWLFFLEGVNNTSWTKLVFNRGGGDPVDVQGNFTFNLNTWYHVAAVRSGNTVYLFVNGNIINGSGTSFTHTINNSTVPITIGACRIHVGLSVFLWFPGYISNLRLVKGTAVYTSNFTPPTAPLTAITNTSLLTCQSNRFVDNSSNAFAITRNGDVRVTPFSPFAPTAAYSPSVNGGSGYFDGSGDYLSIADAAGLRFGTGNFTIQCWIYRNAAGAVHSIAAKGGASTGWVFQVHSDNKLRFTHTTTNIDSTGTIPASAWTHVAVVREGTGTNQVKLYINGVNDGQGTVSTDFNQTEQLNIGADRGNSNVMNGYIAGWKYVVGTAETITVPTAPPTGGTALLNFTNAGIFDNTGKNNLETVGDAQIDTTTKKYGTGSIKFDGNGDNLTVRSNDTLWLGSGQFTIEMWLYPNDASSQQILLAGSDTGSIFLGMNIDGANRIALGRKGVSVDNFVSYTYSTGAWIHLAVTRDSSNNVRFFVGGTQVGSTGSNSNSFTNSALNIGFEPTQKYLNGYIDDLRITKGVARYTANFTPQTSQWQDQ